jgi:hypothetical protein
LACIDQINQHRSRYFGTTYGLQSPRLQCADRNKLNLVIGRQAKVPHIIICNIGIKTKQGKQQQNPRAGQSHQIRKRQTRKVDSKLAVLCTGSAEHDPRNLFLVEEAAQVIHQTTAA